MGSRSRVSRAATCVISPGAPQLNWERSGETVQFRMTGQLVDPRDCEAFERHQDGACG